ncbi:MAG TPA: hypothetical protein ENH32_01175 [Proteobacteria bacterium]|nr:sensory histidine kinase UhpB [bacterium BMS3Abin14]HDL52565.1 hypothetical protein [Pseudomonadota bacterium]
MSSPNRNKRHDTGANILESPYLILSVAALLAMVCVVFSVMVASNQPWLGLSLQADGIHAGIFVESVKAQSPSELILTPGDSILSIRSLSGSPFIFEDSDLVEDPDVFPTFKKYNAFLDRQGVLAGILSGPLVELSLADGRKVRVQPARARPLSSFPFDFWLLNAMGFTVFMIGASVWSVRRRNVAARMFFFSGMGLLITTTAMAVIVSREIALDPDLLATVRALYHVGNNIFSIFGIGLLFHYPGLLGSFPMTRAVAVLASFFILNEQFQWTDIPGHTVLIQPTLYFIMGVTIAALQWRRSKGRPVDRAALKYFIIAFLGFIGLAFFTYFVPAALTGRTVVPVSVGLGAVTMMYVGLALGILRYRLFDIDRWWFGFWKWFLAGVSVLAVDGILAFTVTHRPSVALALSLILVGWLYFPVRQWVWGRFYQGPRDRIKQHLPVLLSGLVNPGISEKNAWVGVLRDVFLPLSYRTLEGRDASPRLDKYGEIMLIPTLDQTGTVELRFADRGSRLFSRDDVELAETLIYIARTTEDRLTTFNRGVAEERERIMRDLHDEVGGRLLSLVHASKTRRNTLLARSALKALRDIIYSINPVEEVTIEEALATWRYELVQRCEDAGVELHWDSETVQADRPLTPRQRVNLSRALYETSSNAFSHASPENIWVKWNEVDHQLACTVRNDGTIPKQGKLHLGKGIRNMERRMGELGGQFSCETFPSEGIFEVWMSMPISDKR